MQYPEVSCHYSRVEIRMLGVGKSQVDRLEICEPKLNADFRFDRTLRIACGECEWSQVKSTKSFAVSILTFSTYGVLKK